ncbi:MAG: hypothetical protein WBM44_24705 [Waterburya sp.]
MNIKILHCGKSGVRSQESGVRCLVREAISALKAHIDQKKQELANFVAWIKFKVDMTVKCLNRCHTP